LEINENDVREVGDLWEAKVGRWKSEKPITNARDSALQTEKEKGNRLSELASTQDEKTMLCACLQSMKEK